MTHFTALVLVTLFISSCLADVNVTDYIYWKKSDIDVWHNFFPLRHLMEERATIDASKMAVSSTSYNLNASLLGVVAFQQQEIQTARLLMNGTDTQGCLEGISQYILKAIEDALDTYSDCTSEAMSKFARLEKSRSSIESSYWAAYQRALSGIDVCQKTYPNKNSYQRLISCVQSMFDNYMKVANSTQNAVFPSPSMSYFQTTVVGCASDAAISVAAKGHKFLEMLVGCAALVEDFDLDSYKQELSKWEGYNNTLSQQMVSCQNKYYNQVNNLEIIMKQYYQMQKEALEKYVIQSRGLDYYLNKIYSLLQDYYNTVTSTTLDNPGDNDCTTTAKKELDYLASSNYYNTVTLTTLDNPGDNDCTTNAKKELDDLASSSASANLACDTEVVNNTISLIDEIKYIFWSLNLAMPSFGNPSIINCFSQGYVFAPYTINECFNILSTGFYLNYLDQKVVIDQDVTKLREFENNFYNGDDLPCGGTTLKRLLLGGDIALYILERCLYYTSGTTYPVTTPLPYTTAGSTSTFYYHTTTSPIRTTTTTSPNTTPSTTTSTISSTTTPTKASFAPFTTVTSTPLPFTTTSAAPSTTLPTTAPSTTTHALPTTT